MTFTSITPINAANKINTKGQCLINQLSNVCLKGKPPTKVKRITLPFITKYQAEKHKSQMLCKWIENIIKKHQIKLKQTTEKKKYVSTWFFT